MHPFYRISLLVSMEDVINKLLKKRYLKDIIIPTVVTDITEYPHPFEF